MNRKLSSGEITILRGDAIRSLAKSYRYRTVFIEEEYRISRKTSPNKLTDEDWYKNSVDGRIRSTGGSFLNNGMAGDFVERDYQAGGPLLPTNLPYYIRPLDENDPMRRYWDSTERYSMEEGFRRIFTKHGMRTPAIYALDQFVPISIELRKLAPLVFLTFWIRREWRPFKSWRGLGTELMAFVRGVPGFSHLNVQLLDNRHGLPYGKVNMPQALHGRPLHNVELPDYRIPDTIQSYNRPLQRQIAKAQRDFKDMLLEELGVGWLAVEYLHELHTPLSRDRVLTIVIYVQRNSPKDWKVVAERIIAWADMNGGAELACFNPKEVFFYSE